MKEITIKANFWKAVKKDSPVFILVAIFVGFNLYANLVENTFCSKLFGINLAFLQIIFITHISPVLVFVATLLLARLGYKSLKYGYYPPLKTYNYFRESKVKSGVWVKFLGYVLLSSPLLPIYLLVLGNSIYCEIWGHVTVNELITSLEIECK